MLGWFGLGLNRLGQRLVGCGLHVSGGQWLPLSSSYPYALFPQPLCGNARLEREADAHDRKAIRGHASNRRIDPDHPPFSIQEWPTRIPTVQSSLSLKYLLAFHAVKVIDFGADHPSGEGPQSTLFRMTNSHHSIPDPGPPRFTHIDDRQRFGNAIKSQQGKIQWL